MSLNLMNVFSNVDFKKIGQTAANVISLEFKANKKNGNRIARAVLDNGTTLIKEVTATGVTINQVINLPIIKSTEQRNSVIVDLVKKGYTQEQTAVMLNISQPTVSKVLHKSK